jgi:probable F420-dependent oxidoreductase
MTTPFRFSVNYLHTGRRAEWVAKVRAAEAAGIDVIMVPDHLGYPAPFSSLVLAAEVTQRARVAPFVLNVGFYNPVLLAREVAGLDELTDGRLDLGLGTGYVQAEFEAAGLPFESAGKRVDRLEHTLAELDRLLADPEHAPKPVQTPRPPVLIGGVGDRVLRLAAEQAEIVGFTGASSAGALVPGDTAKLVERAAYVRKHAGDRNPELNLLLQAVVVTDDPRTALGRLGPFEAIPEEQLIEDTPIIQIGTAAQIAERLTRLRDETGISHFTALDPSYDSFTKVIEHLR